MINLLLNVLELWKASKRDNGEAYIKIDSYWTYYPIGSVNYYFSIMITSIKCEVENFLVASYTTAAVLLIQQLFCGGKKRKKCIFVKMGHCIGTCSETKNVRKK